MLLRLLALAGAARTTAVTQCSATPGGPLDGPCRKGNEFCGALFAASGTAPTFHVMDQTCAENDPNGPSYHPQHRLYHHFWQAHLSTPPGNGPDIGHAVSADLVHWAHLPVAVWNDEKYDNEAIYTFSMTIVNGVPTMIYPGLCRKADWPACDTGTLLAIAVPADLSDPLLTNWTKPAYNPIVENTQRDPSTAWQTASGEWRLTNYEGKIFSSKDFVHWQRPADGLAPFGEAECPDFFVVPAACTGNGCDLPPPAGAPPPTHVHKESSGGDFYTFGIYTDGADGTSGAWAPTAGMARTALDASQLLGVPMTFYASKSFYDPVGAGRRVYWGWALVDPASTQTLPRVTTYHAALQRLIWAPLPELAALRGATLYAAPSLAVPVGSPALLSAGLPPGAANRSELLLRFALPAAGRASFGVSLWPQGYSGAAPPLVLNFSFDAASFTANLSLGSGGPPRPPPSYYMPGIDMPGGDMRVTSETYTDPHLCQASCNATAGCVGFTWVVRPPLAGDCCLKSSLTPLVENAKCTSGVRPGAAPPQPPPQPPHAPIPLLPGDAEIDLHLYMDSTVLEAFVMQGRQALTLRLQDVTDLQVKVEAFAGATAAVSDVQLFAMNSIWVDVPQVLASRRP